MRNLVERGATWSCTRATTSAEELLDRDADAIFLANGPGDPAALDYVVDTLRELVGKQPTLGICLGHQLLCRAVGLETFKLPVRPPRRQPPGQGPRDRDASRSRRRTTASRSLGPGGEQRSRPTSRCAGRPTSARPQLSHVNLYDRTVEGLHAARRRRRHGPVPPRGRARARTTRCYLFDRFLEADRACRGATTSTGS